MGNRAMMDKAIRIVTDYFNSHVEKTDNFKITEEDVFIAELESTRKYNRK